MTGSTCRIIDAVPRTFTLNCCSSCSGVIPLERSEDTVAGVVHEDVDRAEARDGRGHRGGDAALVRDVERHVSTRSPARLASVSGCLAVAATLHPRDANSRAARSPMPDEQPVIRTVLAITFLSF
jgi:hypothetical protein